MKKGSVLIVEDEVQIADLLETNMSIEGYDCVLCDRVEPAFEYVRNRHFDIALLDVMLPDGNGIDLCRKIKQLRPDLPILILSALGQSSDRIQGLKAGADDYLPKPFDIEELFLRMDKLIRRSATPNIPQKLAIGAAIVDFGSFTITRNDKVHNLTTKEALLLKYMAEKAGQVLSRQNMLDDVWGFEQYPNTRTIDNFIATFRKFIESDPNEPQHITTVRGIGYKLNL